ncbi:protein-disulfide reductase DsbD family protein [Dawidia soli]|uniref:Thioredoxin family protein n=1 Tax=Dawidia soli TaxID=2782352 RepID=A0AAP2GK96_9BACT|nr:cytochrome c biogenesis protein CcdA [Dawidia soli]MBT1689390.1 thioredoxin family protein [Dawidia soli]
MLKRILVCAGLLWALASQAQILEPARLVSVPVDKKVKVGDVVELVFKADIDKTWYIYSVGFDADCGPIPMSITIEKNPGFQLEGDLVAVHDKAKHDKIFDCDVRTFEGTGEFRQKVKILAPNVTIKGAYEGQVCSEVEGKCVLFDGDVSFTIQAEGKAMTAPSADDKKKEDPKQPAGAVAPTANAPSVVTAPAQQQEVIIDTVYSDDKNASAAELLAKYGEIKGPILDPDLKEDESKESLWLFFFIAFATGLTALITPCVFPMIPMTVSFFTKGNSRGQALLYGFFIVLIYTLIGAALAPLMGPETANHLATEWIPNLIFFAVFIIFGVSFLGLFEITLPGSLVNKVDQQAEKGGFIGVFFMAFTLVLVSFSCTGPLVSSLLVASAGGEFTKPIVGMLGFSLSFAVPFTLFAFFPSLLKSLPKSGGWLNSVKVILGFIEIALAFKFLSIADQAFHWGVLDREVNIAIWIVVVALIGLYLMKAFRLPGDTGKDVEDKRIPVPRLMLAIGTFTFLVYLIPGMWGAPLKALAGYLPPAYTHDFDLYSATRKSETNEICEAPKYAEFLHLPHNLSGYFDYEQAMACARQQNKPLFIDFTGHGCTNCREMEAVVWSDPAVLNKLRNDFVVVALYVDDKTELPESEWYTSKYDQKVKKTIGKQNADLQIANLQHNAQPFYVLVGLDEHVLVKPYGYDKDVDEFVKFLELGEKKFAELYKK